MVRSLLVAALVALFSNSPALADWAKLQTPQQVAALDPSEALILDIRSADDYGMGHIEGAVNGPYITWRGPKENPGQALSDEQLSDRLGSLGVTRERPVVLIYAGANPSDFGAAARVYWTLKSAGVAQIAILNGGMEAWSEAGMELSLDETEPTPSQIQASLSDRWMLTREQVRDVVEGRDGARLVDARPLEFFEGRTKHEAALQAGTLAGAMSLPHSTWFGPQSNKLISTPEAAAEILRNAGLDAGTDGETLVSFCNTGHWAATNWFALSEVAGVENVKLYPESLVGWSNANLPMVNAAATY